MGQPPGLFLVYGWTNGTLRAIGFGGLAFLLDSYMVATLLALRKLVVQIEHAALATGDSGKSKEFSIRAVRKAKKMAKELGFCVILGSFYWFSTVPGSVGTLQLNKPPCSKQSHAERSPGNLLLLVSILQYMSAQRFLMAPF